MATEKYSSLTNRGTVLTTELNALADGAYCTAGPEYDNTSLADSWGIAQLLAKAFGSSPNLNSPIHLFGLKEIDAANYEDGSPSLRAPDDAYLGSFQLFNNTSDQRLQTKAFRLLPVKYKFVVVNNGGQAMAATLNTVTLFTFNRIIN